MPIRARFVKLTSQASGQITAISLASSIKTRIVRNAFTKPTGTVHRRTREARSSIVHPMAGRTGHHENQAEHSLFQTLSQVHDVHVAKTTEALEIALADEKVSGLLDCPLGTPCFYIETVTEDASGRTIEYSRSYFRGDKTSFVIERSYS